MKQLTAVPSYLLLPMVAYSPAPIFLDKPVSFHVIRGMY